MSDFPAGMTRSRKTLLTESSDVGSPQLPATTVTTILSPWYTMTLVPVTRSKPPGFRWSIPGARAEPARAPVGAPARELQVRSLDRIVEVEGVALLVERLVRFLHTLGHLAAAVGRRVLLNVGSHRSLDGGVLVLT